mmetsp:Transcript_87107/g.106835  ORF Transcript_87107/g.106835 Transcript_87107/m.106835 type:complete len:199 (+) Transcript_87107:3-599(+)
MTNIPSNTTINGDIKSNDELNINPNLLSPSPSPNPSDLTTPSTPNNKNFDYIGDLSSYMNKYGTIGPKLPESVTSIDPESTFRDMNDDEKDKVLNHSVEFMRQQAFTLNNGLKTVANDRNTFAAKTIEGPGFYSFGIIDILQEYNFQKKLERFFKVHIRCKDGYGISCIEPNIYRKRFLAKMLQIGIGRNYRKTSNLL